METATSKNQIWQMAVTILFLFSIAAANDGRGNDSGVARTSALLEPAKFLPESSLILIESGEFGQFLDQMVKLDSKLGIKSKRNKGTSNFEKLFALTNGFIRNFYPAASRDDVIAEKLTWKNIFDGQAFYALVSPTNSAAFSVFGIANTGSVDFKEVLNRDGKARKGFSDSGVSIWVNEISGLSYFELKSVIYGSYSSEFTKSMLLILLGKQQRQSRTLSQSRIFQRATNELDINTGLRFYVSSARFTRFFDRAINKTGLPKSFTMEIPVVSGSVNVEVENEKTPLSLTLRRSLRLPLTKTWNFLDQIQPLDEVDFGFTEDVDPDWVFVVRNKNLIEKLQDGAFHHSIEHSVYRFSQERYVAVAVNDLKVDDPGRKKIEQQFNSVQTLFYSGKRKERQVRGRVRSQSLLGDPSGYSFDEDNKVYWKKDKNTVTTLASKNRKTMSNQYLDVKQNDKSELLSESLIDLDGTHPVVRRINQQIRKYGHSAFVVEYANVFPKFHFFAPNISRGNLLGMPNQDSYWVSKIHHYDNHGDRDYTFQKEMCIKKQGKSTEDEEGLSTLNHLEDFWLRLRFIAIQGRFPLNQLNEDHAVLITQYHQKTSGVWLTEVEVIPR